MTADTLVTPPYLPRAAAPLDLVAVDGTWNAVTVPALWGRLVLDVLAERSGPVLEDPAADHLLWVIPPGGADGWPDATAAGVQVHRQGAELTVCALDGHWCGMRWLRVPTTRRWDTDARLLRLGLEWVAGPLADAQPIQVCVSCAAPTRAGHLLARNLGDTGSGYEVHACPTCWREMTRGGPGRHLHVMKKGPL
ncbi:hypothetical protein D9753_21045 [Streptomyces dangxiongensis]|uniref:Uncharacterized protein n=1 Tax=Streptomyces dangxiongensis TaxID=1442032 RepID=A0A3G2JKV0_9ACTN|nr:hypothetical protein [Streptomyces dangxiongensis]AYN40952.1 hypothetical protein D9753_21045 [Streptomyces dangxiongensis]